MIAFVTTNTITCGGMLVPFEYVSRLKRTGVDADIFAEEGNEQLESFYGIKVRPLSELNTTDGDTIIATRWEQCERLTPMPGKKFQFVQGDDLQLLGPDQQEQCARWRNHPEWGLIGVSRYVLMRWNRGDVVPNGLNERFFEDKEVQKDIDILIEGNNEPNKNIGEALSIAQAVETKLPGIKIAWLGRDTYTVNGVETFTNPSQEDIPAIYQRSKVMIKLSKTEGFCLPILEAMASRSLVVTTTMGGNDDWCEHGRNCLLTSDCFVVDEIVEHLESEKHRWLVERARETAKSFDWNKSIQKLLSCTK